LGTAGKGRGTSTATGLSKTFSLVLRFPLVGRSFFLPVIEHNLMNYGYCSVEKRLYIGNLIVILVHSPVPHRKDFYMKK